ncbi:MAG TPA: WD40 repeat domain-containing protein, partial [Aggregatilineaceae bacterium]|nr:WD40 repeat domain-containing protein [Aggregatilineaceae bacterium]
KTGEILSQWENPNTTESMNALSVNRNGDLLALGAHTTSPTYTSSLYLWSPETQTEPIKWMDAVDAPYNATIAQFAFNPEGTLLAGCMREPREHIDRDVWIWDVESQKTVAILNSFHDSVFSVVFSPDGTLLAYGGADGTIHLWGIP